MAHRKPWAAIRDARLARPARWLLLALAGAATGMMLGEHVTGSRLGSGDDMAETGGHYAGLSSNPDAATADTASAPACLDCADSHGAAARLRARRAERDAALPAPDVIDPGDALPEPAEDYRYGGGFPAPDPAAAPSAPAPVAPDDTAPADDETPPG